jgi:hypothetical protein
VEHTVQDPQAFGAPSSAADGDRGAARSGTLRLRRVTFTDAGHTRYTQLACDVPRPTGLRVPRPPVPAKTPAGRRSSNCPVRLLAASRIPPLFGRWTVSVGAAPR